MLYITRIKYVSEDKIFQILQANLQEVDIMYFYIHLKNNQKVTLVQVS